ncbi:GSCOCG00010314001-RA-CDS [Cotesia congregata]|nr:GSCOCG00010314001-RA-CDS [Cotesia congregata]
MVTIKKFFRVVVGVKFVKKDLMIHAQIKEGQLLPYGGINSTKWKDLEAFDYSEENSRFYLVNPSADSKERVMTPGRDYGPAEKINLEDLVAPPGYLVTGVRFRFAWDSGVRPFRKHGTTQLEIQATKFDFVERKLLEKSFWVPPSLLTNINFVDSRKYLELENPDDPNKAPEELQEVTPGKTVEFQASDFEKDAGHSTVPFFDGRDVEFSPPVPFQGLGLFHRGHKGYGGYLAFRAVDLNMFTFFFSEY